MPSRAKRRARFATLLAALMLVGSRVRAQEPAAPAPPPAAPGPAAPAPTAPTPAAPAPAPAPAAPAPAPAAAPTVTPPQLVSSPPPVYPASELSSGRHPSVVLKVTVFADGSLGDIAVEHSAGPAFDE